MTKTCIVCKKPIEAGEFDDGRVQLEDGVQFCGVPGYGSRKDFDGEGTLCIYLCDDCLVQAGNANYVDFRIKRFPMQRQELLSQPWDPDEWEEKQARHLRDQAAERDLNASEDDWARRLQEPLED